MTMLIGIYGAGGCGRGIMPLARAMETFRSGQFVFIDDKQEEAIEINGHRKMFFKEFIEATAERKQVAIAIAEPQIRARIYQRVTAESIPVASIWPEQFCVMDDVEIGEGALVSPFVTFTSNVKVGRCFHANLYSYVEHDCIIGDFVTFAPSVRCNGNVRIGDFAYIGAGAVIRQGVTIGSNALVGMGAIVTKDVPPGTTVVGNPARILEKK